MKKLLSVLLTMALLLGVLPGAAFAVGEGNFPKGTDIRNVTITLASIDACDYGERASGGASGGAYIFRPSITGRFAWQILGNGEYEAYLFALNDKNIISGPPKQYKSAGGNVNITATLKQSTRYMLVIGGKITLADNGRVKSATAPAGKIQVQVMYDYRGNSFGRPYTLPVETTVKERIRTPYQSDFYKFTVPYDGAYKLNVGGGQIWTRLLNDKGMLIGENKTFTAKKGQIVIVRVNRVERKTGAYTLNMQIEKANEAIPVTKVTLNAKKKEINDGKSTTLKAKLAPAYATATEIKWSSSDSKIATVSDTGVVKGVSPGTAKITATTKSGASATCTVKVKAVKVKSVKLKSKLSMTAETEQELLFTISPSNASNQNVKWSSSKPLIASVDGEGRVTAHKPGKATITVTTVDGKKKAKCVVTVKAAAR